MSQKALLVIDAQVGLVEVVVSGREKAAVIGGLVGQARSANVPVLFVQHDSDEGILQVGSRGWKLHPEIGYRERDLVVRKRASDAFFQTSLEEELRERDVTEVIIVGFQTEFCIDTTARRATTLGLDVTLVEDAHSSCGNEVLTGEQVIKHHNLTLDGFGNDEFWIDVQPSDVVSFLA